MESSKPTSPPLKPRLLIAGGGTGGHVLAGIAVAEVWEKKDWGANTRETTTEGGNAEKATVGGTNSNENQNILFIGAQGGMEEKLVPRAGLPLQLLQVGSLNRVSLKRKIKTLFQLPLSLIKSVFILMRFRPQYVLGVGGYASGPVVLMARLMSTVGLLKARVGILEQNAIPGFTNRILGHFAHVILTAFPGMESRFPHRPVIFTGNPIRSSMKPMPSAPRDPFTLFIFGGSQGAIGINTLVIEALPYLNDMTGSLRFIHQTGEKDHDRVKAGYEKYGIQARIEKFIYDMPATYSESSLLICRSGSSTLAEIAAVGRASILIPLPTAADNHQEHNARTFVEAGAAFLLSQNVAKGNDLAALIREALTHPEQVSAMEKAVTQFFRPNAAKDGVQGLMGQ